MSGQHPQPPPEAPQNLPKPRLPEEAATARGQWTSFVHSTCCCFWVPGSQQTSLVEKSLGLSGWHRACAAFRRRAYFGERARGLPVGGLQTSEGLRLQEMLPSTKYLSSQGHMHCAAQEEPERQAQKPNFYQFLIIFLLLLPLLSSSGS